MSQSRGRAPRSHYGFAEASGDILLDDRADAAGQ
jgi:hypothetical protein